MTAGRFWVIDPAHMTLLAKRLSDQPVEWCYLGTEASTRARAERLFSLDTHVSIAEELTRVAYENKQPFLDWITQIGFRQRDALAWWSSRIASKSPLQTDGFLLVCYAQLVRAWLSCESGSSRRVVIVEDPWLLWVLKRHAAGDARVQFLDRGWVRVLRDAGYWLARAPAVLLYTLGWSVWSMLLARWLWPDEPWPAGNEDRRAVLIYSWIEDHDLSVPGAFQDRYTGRLDDIFRRHGECVKRLTPLKLPTGVLWKLKDRSSMFLVTPRYLRLRDIARVPWMWFRINELHRLSRFQGYDCAPLLYRELLQEWGGSGFALYQLSYRAMSRLVRRCGRSVKAVVYPFENQPWEKLFCMAWRAHAPQVQLIGYQHSWAPPLLLPYALGVREREILPLPDRIVTNSEFNRQVLNASGYPMETLLNGGAFRHEYLYSAAHGTLPRSARADGERTTPPGVVLVTLPCSRPHSGILFSDLLEEFREPLLVGGRRVQFIVKCHPQLSVSMFYRGRYTLPPWITFSRQPVSQMLSQADLVMYAGPTSSWWEASVSGVPVVKYQADFLDIDSGQAVDGMAVQTCSRKTLRDTIAAALRSGASPAIRADRRVVEHMFGRVNEGLWTQLVADPGAP